MTNSTNTPPTYPSSNQHRNPRPKYQNSGPPRRRRPSKETFNDDEEVGILSAEELEIIENATKLSDLKAQTIGELIELAQAKGIEGVAR